MHKECQKPLLQTEYATCPHGRDEYSAKLKLDISPKLRIHHVIMLWWDSGRQKTSLQVYKFWSTHQSLPKLNLQDEES